MQFLPRTPFQVRIPRDRPAKPAAGPSEVLAHVFDERSIAAVNGALAAERPLLVRGEPGVGKTQLAAAAATKLARPLVSFTVDARTEPTDLLWRFDAVQRLAEAQICGSAQVNASEARERLAEWRFVVPGPLWWGFDWAGAIEHLRRRRDARGGMEPPGQPKSDFPPNSGGNPENGVVVLIDEIDKADTDLPNGLLEALGARQFTPGPMGCKPVVAGEPPPLVVITTNQERILPDAFLRRCLILEIPAPDRDQLIERGKAHFPDEKVAVLERAADQLLRDRESSPPPRPGLAEYLDLLRAVFKLQAEQDRGVDELLDEIGQFTLKKHAGGRK